MGLLSIFPMDLVETLVTPNPSFSLIHFHPKSTTYTFSSSVGSLFECGLR
jgi:hypothetical protein